VRRRASFLAVAIALLVAGGAQAVTSFAQRSMAAARADAARELATAVLPDQAREVRRDPSVNQSLGPQRVACTNKYVVEDHRFWRVAGKPAAVWTWMLKHPPKRTRQTVSTTLGNHGTPVLWSILFLLPAQRNVTSRMVAVTLRFARGGGTAIRIDAVAVGEPRPHQSPCVFSSY
jgi:hypothetical protein